MREKKPLRPFKQTGLDSQILATLGTLRFATRDVLARAGVGHDDKHRRERLAALEAAKLISSSGPIAKTGGGRLASFYWLTERGAELASLELGGVVTAPRSKAVNETSHAHREGVARTAVALERLAAAYGGTVARMMFASEAKPGQGVRPMTKLALGDKSLVPDILVSMTLPDGRTRPLAVEFENGANVNDARHALSKRDGYEVALAAGSSAFKEPLGCDAQPRLVMVFATTELLRKVWGAWARSPGEEWPGVFMQSLDALEADGATLWHRIGAKSSPLFPIQ